MDGTPAEHMVVAFLDASVRVRDEVLDQVPVACSSVLDLVAAVNRGRIGAEWQCPSGAAYSKHGFGVRLTSSAGQVVDLEVNRAGQEIFDAWRVVGFARSVHTDVDVRAIAVVLEGFADRGLIARDGGGFYKIESARPRPPAPIG